MAIGPKAMTSEQKAELVLKAVEMPGGWKLLLTTLERAIASSAGLVEPEVVSYMYVVASHERLSEVGGLRVYLFVMKALESRGISDGARDLLSKTMDALERRFPLVSSSEDRLALEVMES